LRAARFGALGGGQARPDLRIGEKCAAMIGLMIEPGIASGRPRD
jgi:hypothetical protein